MIESELQVVGGKHSGQVIPLNRRKFLIGRESDCQLRPNSDLVSRHHCVFAIDEYSVRLRDLGSTNGTTVNGERVVKETTLIAGDRIVVGNLEFEFRTLSPASASGEETVVSNTETVMEVSSPAESPESAPTTEQNQPVAESPASATQELETPIDQPQHIGDGSTVIAQQGMIPGQAPYQPMPQQVGYPGQMYGGYPYQPQQPMPVYPMGYPPPPQTMMPGFQQQPPSLVPGQQLPPSLVPEQQPPPADEPLADVTLPDPSQTGAVSEPPKTKPSTQTEQSGSTGEGDSTNAAADIIRQHTQRRPG